MSTKTDKRYREMTRTNAGKGAAMRPQDRQKYRDNFDRIFGNDNKKVETEDAQDVSSYSESFGQEKI